jgi:3-oxoacyl-(acyl-carrier-protein) synthase
VAVASIKGSIGESGAAGAASLIAGLLSLAMGSVPPTAGLREKDSACPVHVSSKEQAVSGDTFLVNSVASGGTHYSLAVRATRA